MKNEFIKVFHIFMYILIAVTIYMYILIDNKGLRTRAMTMVLLRLQSIRRLYYVFLFLEPAVIIRVSIAFYIT
jgi:hypothetical protein